MPSYELVNENPVKNFFQDVEWLLILHATGWVNWHRESWDEKDSATCLCLKEIYALFHWKIQFGTLINSHLKLVCN